jgi:hypothetical protein
MVELVVLVVVVLVVVSKTVEMAFLAQQTRAVVVAVGAQEVVLLGLAVQALLLLVRLL